MTRNIVMPAKEIEKFGNGVGLREAKFCILASYFFLNTYET